eukprot:1296381-Prymnesium_polylepis.1
MIRRVGRGGAPTLHAHDGAHPPVLANLDRGGKHGHRKSQLDEVGVTKALECEARVVGEAHRPRDIVH